MGWVSNTTSKTFVNGTFIYQKHGTLKYVFVGVDGIRLMVCVNGGGINIGMR